MGRNAEFKGGQEHHSWLENPDDYVTVHRGIAHGTTGLPTNLEDFDKLGSHWTTSHQVAGSFGGAIEEFFNSYFVFSILEPLMKKLRNPKEFSAMFSQGAKSGKSVGVIAGRKYFSYNREAIV
jgi:hypothetical protein